MRYTILSINEDRKKYTDRIRQQLFSWEEVKTECVNGNNQQELENAIEEFGVHVAPDIKVGQAGCTLSTLRALIYDEEPVLVFNDDAILCDNFVEEFAKRIKTLPEDFDMFTCFVPRDHDQNFYWGTTIDSRSGKSRIEPLLDFHYPEGHNEFESNGVTCRAYMRYGGVAMYFSSKGKKEYMKLPQIEHQTDETAYLANYYDKLKVYASVPYLPDLVSISSEEKSLCQETPYYYRMEY